MPEENENNSSEEEVETEESGEETGPTVEEQLAEARREAASLKRSNAALKAQAEKSKTRKQKSKDEDDGPTEREQELQRELEETRAEGEKLRLSLQRGRASVIAEEMGAYDGDDVAERIDFDEIADPSDKRELKQAIARLRKARPYLFKDVDVDHSDGGRGRPKTTSMTDLIRGAARGGR